MARVTVPVTPQTDISLATARRGARAPSRARSLAATLADQYGARALRHVAGQIELFLCIGDYASIALWARAAEIIERQQRSADKPRSPASVEILPPAAAEPEPGPATGGVAHG